MSEGASGNDERTAALAGERWRVRGARQQLRTWRHRGSYHKQASDNCLRPTIASCGLFAGGQKSTSECRRKPVNTRCRASAPSRLTSSSNWTAIEWRPPLPWLLDWHTSWSAMPDVLKCQYEQLPNHRHRNLKAIEEPLQKHVPYCFITE